MSDRVRAEGVTKTWGRGAGTVAAVRGASLAVRAGETVIVTGPSGAGKTTLLAMLGALLAPDAGRVVLGGIDLAGASERTRDRLRRTHLGFVFQRGLLLRHLTVRDNVALPLRLGGTSPGAARARADALLERLGLASRAALLPPALSAGESQRAVLARAVVTRPPLVLANEPTAHLDSAAAATVVAALRELLTDVGAGLVIATHDARLVGPGDRLLRMDDGRLGS